MRTQQVTQHTQAATTNLDQVVALLRESKYRD